MEIKLTTEELKRLVTKLEVTLENDDAFLDPDEFAEDRKADVALLKKLKSELKKGGDKS